MDPIIPDDEARHIAPIEGVDAPDDERRYPEFVDKWDMLEFEDYDEDIVTWTQFEETDEEEDENIAMGVDEQGDDVLRIDYDRDNPSLKEGNTFALMTKFRNALSTYCIKGEYDYVIDKSEPTRMTVHCTFERCQWRIHASCMRNSTIIQVKVNPSPHTCPSERKGSHKVAKSRWCADAVLEWVTDKPCIGTTELVKKIKEKYNILVPYMRVY
jgi:hypothetical protein